MESNILERDEVRKQRHIVWNAFASFCVSQKIQEAILVYFETPENALKAKEQEWSDFYKAAAYLGISEGDKERIKTVLGREHEKEYDRIKELGISVVTREDEEYPEKLLSLYAAPRILYYLGTLPKALPLIAIVGARNCSAYGSSVAANMAKELAFRGIGVVSGLAYGVDKAAHDGALEAGGKTYAVLGCGADVCYPANNRSTYDKILLSGGGIISEYPPGTRPLSCFFPQRNRIIAGMSDGILVTEARKKSGSLITVTLGLEYGKSIYAVPGRIDDALSEGCNYLLKEGAKPVMCVEDILEDGLFKYVNAGKRKKPKATASVTWNETEVLLQSRLNYHLKHTEELLEETGLELSVLISSLEELCRKGVIVRHGQAYYALK